MRFEKRSGRGLRYGWIAASCVVGAALGQLVVMFDVANAQEQTSEAAPAAGQAQAPEQVQDDADTVGAPVATSEPPPPELRESADNNVSFPVDI